MVHDTPINKLQVDPKIWVDLGVVQKKGPNILSHNIHFINLKITKMNASKLNLKKRNYGHGI